jgi:hypothetical protein
VPSAQAPPRSSRARSLARSPRRGRGCRVPAPAERSFEDGPARSTLPLSEPRRLTESRARTFESVAQGCRNARARGRSHRRLASALKPVTCLLYSINSEPRQTSQRVNLAPPPVNAASNLATYERRTWGVVLGCTTGGFVALVATSVVRVPEGLAVVVATFLLTVAFFFAIGAVRTRIARRGLTRGCREVFAVGWTRSPDGCNYAVFNRTVDPATGGDPELVLRLPTRRGVTSSLAFLCGETRPSRWGAASLFSADGEVLGAGRVLPTARGQKIWRRRHAPTPWWSAGGGLNQPADI